MEYLPYIFVLALSLIALYLTLIVRRDCLDREELERRSQQQRYAPLRNPRPGPPLRGGRPGPSTAYRPPARVGHKHFSREAAGAGETPREPLGINATELVADLEARLRGETPREAPALNGDGRAEKRAG